MLPEVKEKLKKFRLRKSKDNAAIVSTFLLPITGIHCLLRNLSVLLHNQKVYHFVYTSLNLCNMLENVYITD